MTGNSGAKENFAQSDLERAGNTDHAADPSWNPRCFGKKFIAEPGGKQQPGIVERRHHGYLASTQTVHNCGFARSHPHPSAR